ncbi:MAG TPA: CotH kinase family protein, partial [Bacteroidota bacterium]|nr:CotH kinase family protein [Bacteroidota bacterium]
MKRLGGFVTLVLFLSSGLFAQIPEISITISHDDSLELYSRDVFSNDYLKASFSWGEEYWKKTELRFKGRSNRSWPKRSFRIRFPEDHLFHGAREINLNAMYL